MSSIGGPSWSSRMLGVGSAEGWRPLPIIPKPMLPTLCPAHRHSVHSHAFHMVMSAGMTERERDRENGTHAHMHVYTHTHTHTHKVT